MFSFCPHRIRSLRFGLIGDVHAEDQLLARTLDALTAARVDHVLCTGDLVDGLGNVDRVCSLLTSRNVKVVRGNHDRWIRSDEVRTLPNAHRMTDLGVEAIAFLKDLPPTLSFDIAGGKLLLCHGVATNDMCRLDKDDFGYAITSNDDLLNVLFDATIRVMVGGHTHRPFVRRFERGSGKAPLFVVNPGTLARDHEPGYAVLDTAAARVDFHGLPADGTITHLSTAALG